MSAMIVLNLSGASARSQGQALRRLQPALSDTARKARRKLVRQNRAETRKQAINEQIGTRLRKPPLQPIDERRSHCPPAKSGEACHLQSQNPPQGDQITLASLIQDHDIFATSASKHNARNLADGQQNQNECHNSLPPLQDPLQLFGVSTEPPYEDIDFSQNGSSQNCNALLNPPTRSEEDRALMAYLDPPTSPPDWSSAFVRGTLSMPFPYVGLGFQSGTSTPDTHQELPALVSEKAQDWFQCCRNPLCEYAYKIFNSKSARDQHLLDHHATFMTCGFCPRDPAVLLQLKDFQSHLRTEHAVWELVNDEAGNNSPSEPTSNCLTCSEMFLSAQGFSEHLEPCILRHLEQRSPQQWADLMLKGGTKHQMPNEEHVLPVYGVKYTD